MSFVAKKLLITFCVLNTIQSALLECRVRIPEDLSLRPTFSLKIGSQKTNLTLNKIDTLVSFFNGQEIEAVCENNFESPERDNTKNLILMKCWNGYMYDNNLNYNYNDNMLACSPKKWNLYEANRNVVCCPSNATSYVLARPNDEKFQYLAGLCYDISNLSFKSLCYTLTPGHKKNYWHPTPLTDAAVEIGWEIKYLKNVFGIKHVYASDFDSQRIQDWIEYSQYNYSSIVQNSLLTNEFNYELDSVLEVVWWPNLRVGNWKRYEEALTTHINKRQQSYDIIAGVSAIATVPLEEPCQTKFKLENLTNSRSQNIPMYVWNYLRSTTNASDEIVIIGVNSPFYDFYEQKDIVFCSDKCQEVDWLKKASTTFGYNVLGIIFCCTKEDVAASKRLDGFPNIEIKEKAQRQPISSKEFQIEDTTVQYLANSYENY